MKQEKIRVTHHALLEWYARHGRKDLPWRNTQDWYAIWVSEVMLQQTQVVTVLERFYYPFLEAFPTVQALAEADLQDVLKRWEGLGYYRRARNLHAAAKQVVQDAGLVSETIIPHLLSLPGIGKNTAHAIAAFGFHQPVPVMEANVKRVLCRVYALERPTEKQLWNYAEELVDKEHPFDYNQAMMDIGAMVCTKRKPLCHLCPLVGICQGKHQPETYPQVVKKKATPTRHAIIYAYYDNQGRYLVQQRGGEFLHGLWGFVEEEVSANRFQVIGLGGRETGLASPASPEPASSCWQGGQHGRQTKQRSQEGKELKNPTITQVYSHFTLQAQVVRLPGKGQQGTWKSLAEIAALPLSKADQKVLKLLSSLDTQRQ